MMYVIAHNNKIGGMGNEDMRDSVETVHSGYFSYKKVRKHVSQMSSKEKDKLREMFKKVKNWEIFSHVNDRIKEKGYTVYVDDVLDLMHKGNIVEYEQKYYFNSGKISHLVVLNIVREHEGKDKDRLHMVFDMTDKGIVTVWVNDYEDTHETLDMGIYSKGLKVGENYWQK